MDWATYRQTQAINLTWQHRIETFPPSQRLLAMMPTGDGIALELGTSRGEAAVLLQHKGYRVIGVDLFPDLLKEAKPGPWYVAGDMHAIPLRDASVALILHDNGLEHSHDVRRAVYESARVLKPGGQVYGMVPLQAQRSSPAHLWSVGSVQELAALLNWAGFPHLRVTQIERDEEEGEQVRFVLRKGSACRMR